MRIRKKEPTAYRLKELLDYCPETGSFHWRVRRGSRRKGDTAGTLMGQGCIAIGIDGVAYLAHRLAWVFMTGNPAPDEIDHENLDVSDNRWSNLRCATRPQNAANRGAFRSNKIGLKGVSQTKGCSTFRARIGPAKNRIYLGRFPTAEEAHAAYCKAAKELYGDFARFK